MRYCILFITFLLCSCTLNKIETYQSVIDKYHIKHNIPGIIALIATPDSLWQGTSGTFNTDTGEKLRPSDKFNVGSLTKFFTSTLIFQLMETKKLNIDDKIGLYLDSHIINNISRIGNENFGNDITVRMLLNNSSGIYEYTDHSFINDSLLSDMSRYWFPNDLLEYIIKNKKEAVHKPGEKQTHCNTGFILLGLIIEKITGQTYHHVLRENIFNSLQMDSTFLGAYEKIPGRFIHGYWNGKDITSMSMSSAWSAGGIVSNNEDLFKFFKALNTGRLFSKDLSPELNSKDQEETIQLLGMMSANFTNTRVIGGTGANLHLASMYYIPEKDTYILFALSDYLGLKVIDKILYDLIESLPHISRDY